MIYIINGKIWSINRELDIENLKNAELMTIADFNGNGATPDIVRFIE